MTADLARLRTQWDDLMQSFGVDGRLSGEAFADLAARYGADGRYYHTLAHIQKILDILNSLRQYARDFPAIQLAAWFHDIIYDPRAAENEAQSARHAGRALNRLGVPAATIANAQRMILATTHVPPYPEDLDCQLLLDADLATFASDWAGQEKIEKAIRQEYAFVPEEVYREGRRQILQRFLQRERIYFTDPMYAAREERARQNITRAIAALD